MNQPKSLSYLNIVRKPGRTAALVIVSLFLSFSILAGTLVVSGLQRGLDSLEEKMGADIMVVPYQNNIDQELSNILVGGTPGTFYMDRSVADTLSDVDGVAQLSSQFFLATVKSGCCSTKTQLISYDPATDFTITPWIAQSVGDPSDVGYLDIIIGSKINSEAGAQMKFYGTIVNVKGKLKETGTYLDSAVLCTDETMKTLIQAARDRKMMDFGDKSPDSIISCVMINVADGYDPNDVAVDINVHIRGVKAIVTQSFVSDVSNGMKSISGMIRGLISAVWVLGLVILILAFTLITNERKKEFAVLRVLGASRKQLSGIIMKEAVMINVIGSAIGSVVAVVLVAVLQNAIYSRLDMPFMLPHAGTIIGLVIVSFAVSVAAGSLAALISAYRISRVDPALILRGDN